MRAFNLLVVFLIAALGVQAQAQVTSQKQQTTDLVSEKDGLKISISSTSKGIGEDNLKINPKNPHINIVLQNTSRKPLRIFEEGSSLGDFNLTLRIANVDDNSLDTPLVVSRGSLGYGGNVPHPRFLEPGEAVVREVRLHVPAQVFDSNAPVTPADLTPHGLLYRTFPVPEKGGNRYVTMSAVYENENVDPDKGGATMWMGKIASPPTRYRVFWGEF